jgi:hypothetical protein
MQNIVRTLDQVLDSKYLMQRLIDIMYAAGCGWEARSEICVIEQEKVRVVLGRERGLCLLT